MESKLNLLNAEGKRLLQKNRLDYSKDIIDTLQDYPEAIPELLSELNVTSEEFFDYISGDKDANITFYDEALQLARKLTNSKVLKK